MSPTKITLHVDRATALREGRTDAGETVLTLTDSDLESLTPTERDQLALHVAGAPGWSQRLDMRATPVGHADLGVIRALLATRAAVVAAEAAEEAARNLKRRADADAAIEAALSAPATSEDVRVRLDHGRVVLLDSYCATATYRVHSVPVPTAPHVPRAADASPEARARYDSARAVVAAERARLIAEAAPEFARREAAREAAYAAEAEEEAAAAEAADAAEAAREAAREAWLRDHATPEQRARAAAGLLPASEVLEGLEMIVWSALSLAAPYQELDADDVDHAAGQYDGRCGGSVVLSDEAAADATAAEFAALERVRALAPAGAVVTLRRHEAECDAHECPGPVTRAAVRVEIETFGRHFRREFAV